MPVQINEVVIRTVVDTQPSGPPEGQGADTPSGDSRYSEEELLERVWEIIQESKER